MPNRLAHETSPYLLQHANNPVDWYPWGTEALDRARAQDRPILLSIGYAACHWCHVMEHESFEDPAVAALMNERFVNIKVDREERPDIDGIYMQAVQAMTGHGGWPMTMFLTPEGVPFYGGTYFPAADRPGMPSFTRILHVVSDAYHNKRDTVQRTAESVREMYAAAVAETRSAGPLSSSLLDQAYRAVAGRYDEDHGGFDGAPKFPQTMTLDFLLRHGARRGIEHATDMVRHSFLHMARGGIYDQIGGGFARYSVDAEWLVPHFEKMCYDNALLIRLGAALWQETKDAEVRRVVEETIDWACRELRSPEGGFYSSYDADSEGHEGKFYVWTVAELNAELGADAPVLRDYWQVSDEGNFEGKNILSVAPDPRAVAARHGLNVEQLGNVVRAAKRQLHEVRSRRVPPGLDDKVLASWNGLMVRGIAEAARVFGSASYGLVATESAEFLFERLVHDGRVHRTYKNGRARLAGYLEDYAAVGLAALAVYELTFELRWLERARRMADSAVQWFWSDETGAFYDTPSDHEALIVRPREISDNATPSGTSLVVELLLRLADLFDDADMRRRGTYVLETLGPAAARYPAAFGHLLGSVDLVVNGATEVVLIGDVGSRELVALQRVVAERYLPGLVLAGGEPTEGVALMRGRGTANGEATAYVCRNCACDAPARSPTELDSRLSTWYTAG